MDAPLGRGARNPPLQQKEDKPPLALATEGRPRP